MDHQQNKTPCLFLDRDGVIIRDHGYVYKIEECEIIPECVEIIKWANAHKLLVIVLTNQSGIAKGFYSIEQYKILEKYLNDELVKRGAFIKDWFFCPYHDEGTNPRYTVDSILRKPKPGMLYEALKKYDIDLEKSIMIGDKVTDVLNDVKLKTFLIKGNYALAKINENKDVLIFENHQELLNYIKKLKYE